MPNFDLILPWIACGLTLTVFFIVRRWVQRHLFGMGWLVAQEQHLATVIYCIVLLPGIFIHEASHWVLAGIFNVRTNRITAWPKADAEGRVDLSFIKIKDTNNPIFLVVIGTAPFVIGFALMLWIGGSVLHLPDFIKAVNTGNFQVISLALQNLVGQPDFVLWFYLMFTISNTLWPEKDDRRGWVIIVAIVVGVTIVLALIGFQNAVGKWFTGPIPQGLNDLTTIFLIMLAIDSVFALGLLILERSTERVTHRYAPYRQTTALVAPKDNKASNGLRLSSILQYQLPLPPAPRKVDRPVVTAGTAASTTAALPRQTESPAQPGLASRSGGPETTGSRPSLPPTTGAQPRPATSMPGSPAFGMASSVRPGAPSSTSIGSQPAMRPAASTIPPGSAPRPALPASTSTPGNPSGSSAGGALSPVSGARPPIGSSGAPPVGGTPRSGIFGAASPNRTEDYIDAEVIEEDEPAKVEPNSRTPDPAKARSGDEPLFIEPES